MNDFDITSLEDALRDWLRALGVSATIFDGRPKSAPMTNGKQLQDFIIVKVSNVRDLAAYGQSVVRISLFAKDVQNVKNKEKLKIMYGKIVEGWYQFVSDKYELGSHPNLLGDNADDYGYHARIIQIPITIKA